MISDEIVPCQPKLREVDSPETHGSTYTQHRYIKSTMVEA